MNPQPGVLAEVPSHARYLTFRRRLAAEDPRPDLERLAALAADESRVLGLGASLVNELGGGIEGPLVPPGSGRAPSPEISP